MFFFIVPAGLLSIYCRKKLPSSLPRHQSAFSSPDRNCRFFWRRHVELYFSYTQEAYFRNPLLSSLFSCISLLPNSHGTTSGVIVFVHILEKNYFSFYNFSFRVSLLIYSLSTFGSYVIDYLHRHQCCDRLRFWVFCSLSKNRKSDLIECGCWRLHHTFLFRNKANPPYPYPKWYNFFFTVSVCEG